MPRTRGALAAAALLVVAACDRSSGSEGAFAAPLAGRRATSAATLLADSAHADSAAVATLPPALRDQLDVLPLLTPAALRDTTRVRCDRMDDGRGEERRHRLRARLPDGGALVVFVRAARATGSLRRVELVRRTPGRGQRGFIWDAAGDETTSVEWLPGSGGASESTPLPRGGPAPRALRGVGRRLLVMPCVPQPRRRPPDR